jgi:phenylalanyl-tRNA synthetase alpha chain
VCLDGQSSFILKKNMPEDAIPHLSGYGEAELDQAFAAVSREVEASAAALSTPEVIENFRLHWLGRKQGRLKAISDAWLKSAPPEARKPLGQRFNKLKAEIEQRLEAASGASQATALDSEAIDITLPGTRRQPGAEHPLIKTLNEIVGIFQRMGYSVGVGPEVETDYYNFESLNFPPGHPARDTQDTLVIAQQDRKPLRDRLLMRTHTSPVQIRTMEQQPPPVRIVIPGKVHRNDAADATHSPIFHQVEGL